MLLDYETTYPNAVNHYKSSDTVFHEDSDLEYLTMIEAIRCYDGHLYLSNFPSPLQLKPTPKRNGPFHT